MTSLFDLSMRYGSRILFAVALLDLVVSIGSHFAGIRAFDQLAPDAPQSRAVLALVSLATALHAASLPFFGALAIDRLDHWRRSRT